VAGPDVLRLDEIGQITLAARRDKRRVMIYDETGMFAAITGDELLAGPEANGRH